MKTNKFYKLPLLL